MDSPMSANELLLSVFYGDNNSNKMQISPIIKNTKAIPSLLEFLLNKNSSQNEKKIIIQHLAKSIKEVIFNAEVFQKVEINNKMNLLKIAVYLYLHEEALKEELTKLITYIVTNYTCDINIFRYTHDYIKQYMKLENDTYDIFDSLTQGKQKLTQQQFLNYLSLLQLLLCQTSIIPQKPYNYLYCFNNSVINIDNIESKGLKITNNESLNFVTWIRLELSPDERQKYFKNHLLHVFTINFSNNSFTLNINDKNELITNANSKNKPYQLKHKQWYCLIIQAIRGDKSTTLGVNIYVDYQNVCEAEVKDVNLTQINSMSFFNGFIGECSGIMIFHSKQKQLPTPFLKHNQQPLFEFGLYDENEISPLVDEILYEKYKQTNISENSHYKPLLQNLIACFLPTRFERKSNNCYALFDYNSGFKGYFINKDGNDNSTDNSIKGIHLYTDSHNQIDTIGGVASFLPIIELLANIDKYKDTIERNVLCNQTLEKYITLFWGVLNNKENLTNAKKNRFFYCLSMFIEKLPTEYVDNVIDFLLQTSLKYIKPDFINLIKQFYENIIFNTTLLLRVSYKTLNKIWEHLKSQEYKYVSNFHLQNWVDLLLKYDLEHNEKFCCPNHGAIFIRKDNAAKENEPKLMEPSFQERMSLFREVVEKGLINEFNKKDNKVFITLIKLLMFELSPCMQLFVFKIFRKFVEMNTSQIKSHKGELQEICKFLMKISFVDVQLEVYDFMFWIDETEQSCLFLKEQNEFASFYLRPPNLQEQIGLVYNRDIFNKTLESILTRWIPNNITSNKNGYYILYLLFNSVKYCYLSYISKFFNNLKTSLLDKDPSATFQSGKHKDKLIDIVFEMYLLHNKKKLVPEFKQSFPINVNEYEKVVEKIQETGIFFLVNTVIKKWQILEELVSWGKLQQLMFGKNETYQKVLISFLKTIFDQYITEKLKLNGKKHLNDCSDEEKKELLGAFIWYYELATFFNNKINSKSDENKILFNLKIGQNEQLQGEFFNNLLIVSNLFASNIWDKEFNDEQQTFHTYIETADKTKKRDYFIKDINLLFSDILISANDKSNQPEQSFINSIFDFYITILSFIPDNDNLLKEWVDKIFKFVHFIIIASSNMKIKEEKIFKNTQNKVYDIIIIAINALLNEREKRKASQIQHQCITDTLYRILELCSKINQEFRKDKSNPLGKIMPLKTFVNESKIGTAIFTLFEKKGLGTFIRNNYSDKLDDKAERLRVFNHEAIINHRKKMIERITVLFDLNNKIENNKFEVDKDMILKMINNKQPLQPESVLINISQFPSSFREELATPEIERKLEFHKKNQKYKKIKKILFSFTNVWSYQKLFLEKKHLLKHKRINHLTKDMTRLILVPILDIYSYVPKFSRFKTENLFFKESPNKKPYIPYLVDLSPMEYPPLKESDYLNIMETSKQNNPNFPMNIYYNYIQNESVRRNEQSIRNSINPNNIILQNDNSFKSYLKNKHNINNDNNTAGIKIEECCFVKESYHIKGYFIITTKAIHFYAYKFDNSHIVDEYDKDRTTCFGSIFKHPVDGDKNLHISIKLHNIEMILKRRYFFRVKALEIFTKHKKHYYFKFHEPNTCEKVMSVLKNLMTTKQLESFNKNVKYIGILNTLGNPEHRITLKDKYEQWKEWKISTLEFLMYLNVYGNRSFIDLMQYPVMPWPIFDYSSSSIDINENNPNIIRDFSLPMGMQVYEPIPDSLERRDKFLSNYQNMINEYEEDPHHFSSHYSNSYYVAHFTDRLFPIAYLQIELQGNIFDDPNRLFINIAKTSSNTLSLQNDVREIIPEFFCAPEIFMNYNDFDFGNYINQNNEVEFRVNHVFLPKWCQEYEGKNAYTFVYKFRKLLEHQKISNLIHGWFDIIFGYKLQSQEANNSYLQESSEDFESTFINLPDEEKEYKIRTSEFGVCPSKLFSSAVAGRKKINELNRRKPLNEIPLTTEILQEMNTIPLLIKIAKIGNKNVLFQLFNDRLITYNITEQESGLMYYKAKFSKNQQEKLNKKKYSLGKDVTTKYKEISMLNNFPPETIPPIAIFNDSKTVIIGGFWSGELMVLDFNNKQYFFRNKEKTPVTSITIDIYDYFIVCGTKKGSIYVLKNKGTELSEYTVLKTQKSEIVDIVINNQLNILLSLSKDGYAAVYTFPSFKLINYFYVHSNVNQCFISNCPLPCFVFLIDNKTAFKSVSLNGEFLIEQKVIGDIKHVRMFKDFEFSEYLVYVVTDSSESNTVEIRTLPYLQIESSFVRPTFNNDIVDMDVANDNSYLILLEKGNQGEKHQLIVVREETTDKQKMTNA